MHSVVLIVLLALGTPAGAALARAPGPTAQQPDAYPVRVEIEGIRGELRQNVISHLSLSRDQRARRRLTAGELQRRHAGAEQEVRAALEPFGYYQAAVSGEPRLDRDRWVVRYRVEPGPPVRVGAVNVEITGPGAEDEAVRQARSAFPLEVGDRLRHAAYEQGKRMIQAAALERGYLDASFTERRVVVDRREGTARIVLRLETGPRYRFGPVHFPEAELDTTLLQGFVPFDRGAPLTSAAMLELQRVLRATDLFNVVEVELLRAELDGLEVPVEVRLTPRPRARYDLGLGYGTDTGPRGTASTEQRRINRYGHQAEAEIRTSLVQNGLTARYLIPLPGARGERIAFSAGVLDERAQDARSTRATISVVLDRGRGSWRENLFLSLQEERFGVGDERGRTSLVLPGGSWTHTSSDDLIYPTRGHRIRLDLTGTHQSIGSGVSFAQAAIRTRGIFSPWRRGRVLVRTEVGLTAVGDVASLPVSLRYFAGGDRSVRGYPYRGLGPTTAEDAVRGGRHLLVAGLEYEHRFLEDWGAAVFVDSGNASDHWPVNPKTGVGLGARWRSPIGLVRVDLAAPLTRTDWPVRLHLAVGPDL